MIDFFFQKSCENPATVVLESKGRLMLTNRLSKKSDLIFIPGQSVMTISVGRLPSESAIKSL